MTESTILHTTTTTTTEQQHQHHNHNNSHHSSPTNGGLLHTSSPPPLASNQPLSHYSSHNTNKMEPPVSPTPSEQQYALKWNDFQSSILSSFRHLREEEDFVDVTLACDQRSFTAHKVVLSACSPYFRKLLKANPCEHPIIILRDVRCEDIESLLRFMYNGEVNIGHEQLSDFLKTAQLLQVRGLAEVTGTSSATSALISNSHNISSSSHRDTPNNSNSQNGLNTSTSSRHSNSGNHKVNSNNTPSHLSGSGSALNMLASVTNAALLSNASQGSHTSGNAGHRDLTPAIQELKPTPSVWGDERSSKSNHSLNTPPPQKRIKSVDLYRAQHGMSPDRPLSPPTMNHLRSLSRDRDRDLLMDRHEDKSRDRSLELHESLLGQALEGGPTLIVPSTMQQKHAELGHNEDSQSSDDGQASDRDDDGMDSMNGSMDHNRGGFPAGFLGLHPLMPGPSAMHGDNFVSRRSLEIRVRATDPRPCPKCGKIYRSAHTLRTHLEDKHTVCPGYRCVLCGTVAKSRNSLHSHMSRQHRGISTKDLPVLPMPSPFDPELASRLLAKAGVKISPAELRARASPTGGTRRNDMKLEARGGDGDLSNDMDDDPEDLTMAGNGGHPLGNSNNYNNNNFNSQHQPSPTNNHPNYNFHYNNNNGNPSGVGRSVDAPFNHPNTTITRVRHGSLTPKANEGKDGGNQMQQHNAPTGSTLLDTYLQFITENTFGMGMTQEQAAAALHAAKMAQLGAMGHNFDKLPAGLLPPQMDLAKLTNNNNHNNNNNNYDILAKMQQSAMESSGKRDSEGVIKDRLEIRRGNESDHEPMDLGLDQTINTSNSNNGQRTDSIGGASSSAEEGNYSDEEGHGNA